MEQLVVTKVNGLQKIKQYDGSYIYLCWGIHFKVDGQDYFLHLAADMTPVTQLYKGRMKGHVEHLRSCYGWLTDILVFKRRPGCLKDIDTEHFMLQLKQHGLWVE